MTTTNELEQEPRSGLSDLTVKLAADNRRMRIAAHKLICSYVRNKGKSNEFVVTKTDEKGGVSEEWRVFESAFIDHGEPWTEQEMKAANV
jgi:hypothetical protein